MEWIKNTLVMQQREINVLLLEKYIPRTSVIHPSTDTIRSNLIKVIIGPRRAGKSSYAIHLLTDLFGRDSFAYLNLDDEKMNSVEDFDNILSILREIYPKFEILLIDEVQNFPKWELVVNRLQRQGLNLMLTGSNAQLLSYELATHLTGRYIQIAVFPFSFPEFCKIDPQQFTTSEYQSRLLTYMEKGGYPEPAMKKLNYTNYLNTLLSAILYKDIIRRFRIRHSELIDRLLLYMLSNITKEFSSTNLAEILQCSDHTVEKYLAYLQESFLLFEIPRYSPKVKIQIKSNRKIYCHDTGFYMAKAFAMSSQPGKLYENLIAKIFKQAEILGLGKIYFWKNDAQEEIDFVWLQNQQITQLIQVCTDPTALKVQDREYRALLKGSHDLKCDNLWILTESKLGAEEISWGTLKKTAQFMPVWQWLVDWEEKINNLRDKLNKDRPIG